MINIALAKCKRKKEGKKTQGSSWFSHGWSNNAGIFALQQAADSTHNLPTPMNNLPRSKNSLQNTGYRMIDNRLHVTMVSVRTLQCQELFRLLKQSVYYTLM